MRYIASMHQPLLVFKVSNDLFAEFPSASDTISFTYPVFSIISYLQHNLITSRSDHSSCSHVCDTCMLAWREVAEGSCSVEEMALRVTPE